MKVAACYGNDYFPNGILPGDTALPQCRHIKRSKNCAQTDAPKARSVRIFASAYFGSGGGVGYTAAAASSATSTRKWEKSSEEAAFEDLESYGATVYMGAPVIQADLGGKGGGLSYGIITLPLAMLMET